MLRFVPRPALACLLLLCLLRTLLPEAWVLAWHPHEHTTHEPAFATGRPGKQPLLSPRHQHCHTEQFYDVPFVAAGLLAAPTPRVRPRYCLFTQTAAPGCRFRVDQDTWLRGPPAG